MTSPLKVGYIYFLHCGGNNGQSYVKIGYSVKPTKRMCRIRDHKGDVHLPHGVRLHTMESLGYIAGTRRTEAEIHRSFSSHRTKGEWFLSGPELLSDIRALSPLPLTLPPMGERQEEISKPETSLPVNTESYLSPDEVATVTGKTRQTVYNWIKSGELPAKKIGRTWLVNRQDIS